MVHPLRRTKGLVQSWLGMDVRRFPRHEDMFKVCRLLNHWEIDTVLDVGANDGGYARGLRRFGYSGQVHSFEPLTEPYRRLAASFLRDPKWRGYQAALGAENGTVIMNVASNHGASSSILPMAELVVENAPGAAYCDVESVQQHRLDDWWAREASGQRGSVFLKLDVQGYEENVLRGAGQLLAAEQLKGVQIEVSFQALYVGGWHWKAAVEALVDFGFEVRHILPGFESTSGELLQADFIFARSTRRV